MEGPFPAYQGDEPYIFVSYAHDDADLVFPELSRLRAAGFNVWYDEGIQPGLTWREEVALALTESRLFLYFLTENSVQSENCQQELNFALSRERRILAVHLTPVQLTAGIELSLSNKQAILKPEMDEAAYAAKLLGAVRSLMPVMPIELPTVLKPGHDSKRESIAIMPFANRSSDPENEYLCDGIVEELVTGMTKIDGLTVCSQLQTYAFKDRTEDVREIGRKLKTQHVLNGAVQKSGQRIRVNVTLIETDNGSVIWSERYDGTIEDVFELQEDVAGKVLDALKLRLGSDGEAAGQPIIELGTDSPAAYEYLLLGRHENGKRTLAGLIKARAYYARALAEDPQYGKALYYDLRALCNLRDMGHLSQEELMGPATERLEQVFASTYVPSTPRRVMERVIDPTKQVSVRESLSEVLAAFKDPRAAWHGFELKRAGDLLAGAGLLNSAWQFYEAYRERYPDFADEGEMEGIPVSSVLIGLGRFEKAIEYVTAIYARHPWGVEALGVRAMLYSRTGQYAKAEEDLEELAKTFPRNFPQFYDLWWRREWDAAQELFDWLMSRKNLRFLFRAQACFLMNEIDRGVDEILTTVHRRNFGTAVATFLRIGLLRDLPQSIQKKVLSHPKYQALMAKTGVDDQFREDLMTALNEVEHVTGIHVAEDEDY